MNLAIAIFGMAAICALCLYVVGQLRRQRNSLFQIHELVNSRLTEALTEIRRLGGNSDDF